MSRFKPNVLIVDDGVVDNKVLSMFLKRVGIQPVTLFSEHEVARRISETRFDVCFVDLNLSSELSGFAVISEIKKILGPSVKIIVISGRCEPDIILRAIELGADDYFVKPFDFSFFAAKLARYCVTPQLELFRADVTSVPGDLAEVEVEVECQLKMISDSGLVLEGRSLVNKGSVFHLSGEIVRNLIGVDKPLLVTVTRVWQDLDMNCFCAFATFDSADPELKAAIRRRLSDEREDFCA